MSFDREDSITEDSPLFQAYLQELQQIFRDDDSAIIKAAILKYQIWEHIIEALLNEDEKRKLIEEEAHKEEEELENNNVQNRYQDNLPNFGFSMKATSYDNRCRLYLPQSLISIDMDLHLFGSFDGDEIQNFKETISVQQLPQMRQQNVPMNQGIRSLRSHSTYV